MPLIEPAAKPFVGVVAVTGGSGLIGRRLLQKLAQQGLRLRRLSRIAAPPLDGEEVVVGDLRDPRSLRELVREVQAVVHLGGVAHTSLRTSAEHEQAYAINVEGTRQLLRESQRAGVSRFLLASSAHVYAGQRGVDLDENSPTGAAQPYARMKLQAEAAAELAGTQGMSVAMLRPCLTYGPGVRYNLQTLLRALHRRRFMQMRGAETIRSMASVDTVAMAFAHLLTNPQCTGAYNVADREPVVLERWVEHLSDLMQVHRPLRVPAALMASVALAGSVAARTGVHAPLTRSSLRKLTEPFSLNTSKLAATGFVWPDTTEAVLEQMIEAEFLPTRRTEPASMTLDGAQRP